MCPPRSFHVNSLLDKVTSFLIYFTIIWGPWAYGSVHEWAILVLNLSNFTIGFVLITKFVIRTITGYSTYEGVYKNTNYIKTKLFEPDW